MSLIYLALFIDAGLIMLIIWVQYAAVDRINDITYHIRDLHKQVDNLSNMFYKLEGQIEAHEDILADKATKEDIERAANSYLNLRNEVGKVGTRVQLLENRKEQ
jgi:uncharacterized protein (DUF342 family)